MPIRPSICRVGAEMAFFRGFFVLLTLIQHLDSNFVAVAFTSDNVLGGNFQVVEIESARRGSTNAEFLFLFRDLDPHVLGGKETGNSFVSFARVNLFERT